MAIRRSPLSAEQLLSFFNLFLMVSVAGCAMMFFLPSSKSLEDSLPPPIKQEKSYIPKNPFAQPSEAYEKIGEGPFALQWIPPQLQLPDLRQEVIFLGRNERPDVPPGSQLYYVSVRGKGGVETVRAGEKTYLAYQGVMSTSSIPQRVQTNQTALWGDSFQQFSKGVYSFSPGNQPTPLWFEVRPLSEDALEVSVGMLDEKGCYVESPSENRSFILSRSEGGRSAQGPWEIGGHRVDSTYLLRQKVRWTGPDIFLAKYGGDEFAFAEGRQRIDFVESEVPYTCFVKADDFLIWKDGKWKLPGPSESTLGYPLLAVKKIDDKVMVFELWDTDGKNKVPLTIIRMRDFEPLPNLEHEFKFVGAKTWAQFIVECRAQRMILRPHDWLVLTKEGWHKISSPQEVDDFVCQKITGPLFILEKMTKKNGRQALVGCLFNSARTEMQEIELSAVQSPLLNPYPHALSLPPPLKADAVQELKGEAR